MNLVHYAIYFTLCFNLSSIHCMEKIKDIENTEKDDNNMYLKKYTTPKKLNPKKLLFLQPCLDDATQAMINLSIKKPLSIKTVYELAKHELSKQKVGIKQKNWQET